LQRDMISPHPCVHPGVHRRFPRRLLTRGQTPKLRRSRTQYHGRSLHVLHVVLPPTKLKSRCCFLIMIRTVITTRMARSPWYLPCAGVARAVARVTIFRRGTIELSHALAVKCMPPTSPFGIPALPIVPPSTPIPPAHSRAPPYPCFNSFPPHSSSEHQHLSQDWISGASDESTPSITNSSSSSPRHPFYSDYCPSLPPSLLTSNRVLGFPLKLAA